MASPLAIRTALVGLALVASGVCADPPARSTRFEKDRLYLHQVNDFTALKVGAGDKPVDRQAYCDLMIHAHTFTPQELAAGARKDVAYSNLMAADETIREDVRFELVQMEGRLKRLKRIGTFDPLREAGIPTVYEAWIFPNDTAKPLCVHLSEPPDGIEPELDINPGKPVRVSGYFFKVVRYQSEEINAENQNAVRQAPLLIGRSLEATDPPAQADGQGGISNLLPVLFIGVGVVLVGIVGMALWLRRTDAGVRVYEKRSRENPFVEPDRPNEPRRVDG